MNVLVMVYKKMLIRQYNTKHKTNIRSVYASLSAKYGRDVRIEKDTRIASDVVIGDYSYVNDHSSIENAEIGKFCSISSGVYISPYNHNLRGITTHPVGDVNRKRQKVNIGNDVLISLNVTVVEGIHIDDGAVIGAGAVVTHDIGKYEVWGGVPARFIKYRISNDDVRHKLAELQWWDMPDEERNRIIEKYRDSLEGIMDLELEKNNE